MTINQYEIKDKFYNAAGELFDNILNDLYLHYEIGNGDISPEQSDRLDNIVTTFADDATDLAVDLVNQNSEETKLRNEIADLQNRLNALTAKLDALTGNDMLSVTLFCDTTPLFTQEEIDAESLCNLKFPRGIVEGWYQECVIPSQYYKVETPPTLDDWLENEYTADDTDTLYEYAVRHGFMPKRDK